MKHLIAAAALLGALSLSAQEYNDIPYDWKWVGDHEVALTYDGSFTAEKDYSIDAKTHKKTLGISYPEPTRVFPFQPEGAVNLTYSPDSSKMAFTRDNDLWVVDVATKNEIRLTSDGSDVIRGYITKRFSADHPAIERSGGLLTRKKSASIASTIHWCRFSRYILLIPRITTVQEWVCNIPRGLEAL